jgi:DNA-binding beta-propeller fold protein YncE
MSTFMNVFTKGGMLKRFGSSHWIAGLALMGALLFGIQTRAESKKHVPETERNSKQMSELIWPLPPDRPRVRWLTEYRDMARLKKPEVKKRGWLDKVTGAKAPDEKGLELGKPYGVTTDSTGRIYVADGGLRVIFVIDPSARAVRRIESSSRAPILLPVGLATDSQDRLFVSDAQLHSITCFSPEGEEIARFGGESLGRPGGIAVDRRRNRLYAADAKEGRIAVFDLNKFSLVGYFGSPSKQGHPEKGTFSGPSNVAVDRQGNLYVADTLNCRIQVLSPAGKTLRTFGTQGDQPGEFIRPKGIALDSEGHVYVADAEFNNFQIFSPEGQPLLAVGVFGTNPGEFSLIAGLHIDSADRIYTTEMYIGRVQVFQYIPQPASSQAKGGG